MGSWRETTSDKWILQTVSKGSSTDLEDLASIPLCTAHKTERLYSDSEKMLFRKEICRHLQKGVIKQVKKLEEGYVSSIFLREKKDKATHRLMLNLKKVNENVVYRHFKMDNLSTVLNMVRQDCYMANTDLADAYYTVHLLYMDQKFLLFQFEGNLYKYTCSLNDLSSASRIFTKILKPVFSALRKEGHQIMGYLDDTFLMGDTFNECKNAVLASVKLITNLGYFIHPEKSNFFPSQEIEFLGFIINSKKVTVSLSESKQNDIKAILKEVKIRGKIVIRTLAKLIGKLEAALPGIQHSRLYL